jgi:hypothetical protein
VDRTVQPPSLPTPAVWLDGSDPSLGQSMTNGTVITSWKDPRDNSKVCTSRATGALTYINTGQGLGSGMGCIYHNGAAGGRHSAELLNSGITFGSASYTVSVLCKITNHVDVSGSGYVVCGPSDVKLYFGMWTNAFVVYQGASWAGGAIWPTRGGSNVDIRSGSPWVHLCATYDSSRNTVAAYLNGSLIESRVSAQNADSSQTIYIGGGGRPEYTLQTYIADVRTWGSCLDGHQIEQLTADLRAKFSLTLA